MYHLYLHTYVLSVEDLYLWDAQEIGGATLAGPVAVVRGVISKLMVTLSVSVTVLVVVVPDRCKHLSRLYSTRRLCVNHIN